MNRNVWNAHRNGPWYRSVYRRGDVSADEVGGRVANRGMAPEPREHEETMEEEIARHLRTLENRRRH